MFLKTISRRLKSMQNYPVDRVDAKDACTLHTSSKLYIAQDIVGLCSAKMCQKWTLFLAETFLILTDLLTFSPRTQYKLTGNTKICCRAFILVLFHRTITNKIDSEHIQDYKKLLPECEVEILQVTVKKNEVF